LLDAGRTSDGALGEILGNFYSNVLVKTPRAFLFALRSRPSKQQRHLCWMAGATDGSGMGTEMLRQVRHSLRVISSRRNDSLSSVARICLINVNRANALNDDRFLLTGNVHTTIRFRNMMTGSLVRH
jgi:hypothetical protein